jgi:transposase InsO family protein
MVIAGFWWFKTTSPNTYFFFSIANKDALMIAALLVHDVLSKFGFPKKLQSDQGSEFNNLLVLAILEAANVDQSSSSAYHPMTQVSVERFNGTMKTYLSRVLKPEEKNLWDMVLRKVDFACNVSVHSSTLLSPFEMLEWDEAKHSEIFESPRIIEKKCFNTSRKKFKRSCQAQ